MPGYLKTNRVPWFLAGSPVMVFLKAQLSAFAGGVCDYAIMISLTTYGHIFYGYSILVSGAIGAVINFTINRYWTFKITEQRSLLQLQKFIVMVAGSILLKSYGTWLLTTLMGLDYRLARICTDAVVSFAFNFTLQKYWVFRN